MAVVFIVSLSVGWLLLLSLGRLQLLATWIGFEHGWCKHVKHYVGKPDRCVGLLLGWSVGGCHGGMNDTLYRSDHFQEDEYWSSNKSSKITKVF
jgi:hypothetical protein